MHCNTDGNRRVRTRTLGGVGGAEPQGSPLSRFVADYCFMTLRYLPPITLRMAVAPEPSPTSFIVVSPETPL